MGDKVRRKGRGKRKEERGKEERPIERQCTEAKKEMPKDTTMNKKNEILIRIIVNEKIRHKRFLCVAKANEIINAGSADQTEQLTEGFLREEEGVKE